MEDKDEKRIDLSELAKSIAEKIPYEFLDMFLVKPLDPIKVKKEFSKPVSTGTPAKDKNGVEAQDFNDVETEVKEVDSDYRKVVVIKTPLSYQKQLSDQDQSRYISYEVKVGDILIIKETAGYRFDLIKDSRLIRLYDVYGVEV